MSDVAFTVDHETQTYNPANISRIYLGDGSIVRVGFDPYYGVFIVLPPTTLVGGQYIQVPKQ